MKKQQFSENIRIVDMIFTKEPLKFYAYYYIKRTYERYLKRQNAIQIGNFSPWTLSISQKRAKDLVFSGYFRMHLSAKLVFEYIGSGKLTMFMAVLH